MNQKPTLKKPVKTAAQKAADKKLRQLIKQDRAERARFKHLKVNFMENRFGPLVFVLLFAGVGAFLIFRGSASPKLASPAVANNSQARMWLVPSKQTVSLNSTLTAEIWVDSGDQAVNAVQADLSYPTDRLQFVNIDTEASAFGVGAEAKGANGRITVARGNIAQLIGKQLVAKVTFQAIAADGQADLTFSQESRLLRSSDNLNILARHEGGVYMLSK